MPYTNPWVRYISRSYEQIKTDLLQRLVIKAPEITDHSESNILIIILSMVAGCFEQLNLYIDFMAQESFVQTVRRLPNMLRLVKLLDYRVKAANPASTDVIVIAIATSDGVTPVPLNAPYTIPAFTIFSTAGGTQFMNTIAVTIAVGETGGIVPVKQISLVNNQVIGTSDGLSAQQEFSLGQNYVFGSVSIMIAGIPWIEVTSLGLALSTDRKFIVEVHEDGNAYAIFGDGVTGAIPPAGSVIASYQTTLGPIGNVARYAITTANPGIALPTATLSNTAIYNETDASGGLLYEDIERIRVSAPLSIRTLDRAVTYQDYEDIARLCPGVGKAKVLFECGKTVDIYIAPAGGGIANVPLLTTVSNFFEPRRMVTTTVRPIAAGETPLQISMDVTAKFRADILLTNNDVQNALLEYGSFAKQNINRKIRISDIVAKVDNLPRVDFLTITALATIPYARPNNHNVQFIWTRKTLPNSLIQSDWLLEYQAFPARIRIFKDTVYMAQIPIGNNWTDPGGAFNFTPFFGLYTDGMQWKFRTYPFKQDIDLNDYTMPLVRVQDLNIQVFEQFNPPI